MNYRALFFALAVPCSLVACGGSTPSNSTEPTGEEPAGLEQAATDELVLPSLLSDAPEADAMIATQGTTKRWALPRPLYKLLRAWETIPTGCFTESPWVDHDGDGIPADYTVTFSCTTMPNGGSITGAVVVRDTDDDAAQSGFEMEFQKLSTVSASTSGVRRTRGIDGWVAVIVRGAPPKLVNGLDLAYGLTFDSDLPLASGARASATETSTLIASYIPDTDVAKSDPLARGTLHFDGQESLQFAELTTGFAGVTDPTLHFDRACAESRRGVPSFDGGAVLYRQDGGLGLHIQFHRCGGWTTSYSTAP